MEFKELNTLGDTIYKKSKELKDKVFISFQNEKSITYEEINEISTRIANGFYSLGIKKGDKVAMLLPNSLEIVYTWFALAKLGAIEVPINLANKGYFLSHVLNDSESKIIVIDHQLLDRLKLVENDLVHLKKVIVWSKEGMKKQSDIELKFDCHDFEKLYDEPSELTTNEEISPKDPACIIYTSGTTGLSKGVVCPHAQIYLGGVEYNEVMRTTSEDIFFTSLPLFHANAQWLCTFPAMLAGGTVVIYERFSATKFWEWIRKSKATLFNSLGAMAQFIYNQPAKDAAADNPVERCMAAPMPKDIFEDFEKKFNLKVVEGYGLTETCMPLYNPFDKPKPGSCGVPTKSFEVMIVDEHDDELPHGQVGEIVIRSKVPYGMSLGYYKMPEKTVETWKNFFFHTGDAGVKDKEGYVYFRDRIKDYIRRRGENISSFEVESVVNSHPYIFESAAIGVKSKVGEDEVKIVVVLYNGKVLAPEDLLAYCEERMPYFAIPRYIEFVNNLPKTPNEKVRKVELREAGITPFTWDREKAGYKIKR